jgi:anti-sigma factor RsiW
MTLLAYVPGTRAWRRRRAYELCLRTAGCIEAIVDGELPPGKAARTLERHLEACPPCHQEADVIRTLKAAIARVSSEADPDVVRRLEAYAKGLCEGRQTPE